MTDNSISPRENATGQSPRIYNLHPLLAGQIDRWQEHLPRVAAMGFDWVYVNAFWEPGASRSIYAVRNPYELHPLVRGEARGDASELTAEFFRNAADRGLKVMVDLIVPHAARDAALVAERPGWFRYGADGSPVVPILANPNDPHTPRVMSDLAELDLAKHEHRSDQLNYFADLALHFLDLGASGFRCSSAYKVPPDFWRELNARIRQRHPRAVMLAAALGCPFEQVLGLAGCGFDLIFDSSRWWDLRARWFLEQREELRRIAPTVAFPEDHNTARLAEDLGLGEPEAVEAAYRARYLVAVGIASGVLMPMGFEYGARRRIDPISSRPEDWTAITSSPEMDISGFITAANEVKAGCDALAGAWPLRRVTAPNGRVVGLLRLDAGTPLAAKAAALLLVNPDVAHTDGVDPGPLLTAAGGRICSFSDATPCVPPIVFQAGAPLTLDPLGVRLLVGQAGSVEPGAAPSREQALARLEQLASNRVAIEKVTPELDGGRFPVKRVVGDVLTVAADIFADGHDRLAAAVKYRPLADAEWSEVPMRLVDNDRWAGELPLTRNTRYRYTVEAWRDLFESWRIEVGKKHDASVPIGLELIEGRTLLERASENAAGEDLTALRELLNRLDERKDDHGWQLAIMLGDQVRGLMRRCAPRTDLSRYERELEAVVDRTAAGFASWYELFPRSMSDDPNRHGTFEDVIRKLPYVCDMGFDVLYFPPIHPIGRKNRKGRNNSLTAGPDDPGSPYAIGSELGGHDAIHPELGDEESFKRLVAAAQEHGLEIALDFAIQAAPDHPWIKQHPEWFDWRPDGTIKYAENPPKKYEDIVHLEFQGDARPGIWFEIRDVFLHWISLGVKTFRVDNPHTKPIPFWEWAIREIQDRHPDTIFLSEAFTRPKVMRRLAKVGFSQSYSYFTWRNTKAELTEYLTELTQEEPREHMRPNFFVNTPDINPVFLQNSGRAGFRIRAALASMLSPLWGVYSGFELCEATPVPGREEYLDSEKYEIKAWDWNRPGNIRDDITKLNLIRRANPALWHLTNLEFHTAWNDQVLVFSKRTAAMDNVLMVAINLDPHQAQGCHFEVPLWRFGLDDSASIQAEDLLGGSRFTWAGKVQHIWLDPQHNPYAIWRLVPPGLPT